MKKCDHFKGLILTDYIDGEIDKNLRPGVEEHLLDCGSCRAFFRELKNSAVVPFQQTVSQPVPVELWSTIRQNIEAQEQEKNRAAEFINGLKSWIVFPRLVPVFASLMVMLLAGSATLNNIQLQQNKNEDQGEYLAAVLNSPDTSTPGDNNDPPTPIEHYFL